MPRTAGRRGVPEGARLLREGPGHPARRCARPRGTARVSARRLRDALEGRRLTEPERHGKWLLARTGGPTLMLHFGMTGRLLCAHPDDEVEAHDRVLFTVARDRQLRYHDQRKLQGLWLADDESQVARLLVGQGLDALAVDREEFTTVLSARRSSVKRALTDQSVLAGLGNLLADEILWRAGLRPPAGPAISPRTTAAACTPTCAAPCAPRSPPAASHPAPPG